MNRHLNFKRLILLINKFWFGHRKVFLLLMLAILSLFTIWLGIYLGFSNPRLFNEDFQVAYYFLGLLMSGCLSANFLFADLGNKPKAIGYLLEPASSLEKIVCSLFFGVFVFWIGYSMMFYLVDAGMVHMANRIYGTQWTIINIFSVNDYENPFFPGRASNLFFIYFASQALFITGSLYFRKYTFFKTAIVALFIGLVLVIIPSAAINISMPLGIAKTIMAYKVLDFRGNKLIEMPSWFDLSVTVFSFYLLTPAFWLICYFLLREKQVS